MKILHVATTINRGGAENHLVDLVAGQVKRGHNVSVAYLKGDGYWTSKFVELGVPTVSLRLGRYGELQPLFKLRSWLRHWAPDLVHAHLPPAELYTRFALVGTSRGIDFVITKHADIGFLEGSRGKQSSKTGRWLARWVASRAKRIIAVSEAVKDFHAGPCENLGENKFRVVLHGVDAQRFQRVTTDEIRGVRKFFGFANEDFVVGTVARLAPEKNLDVLLRGFARFVERNQKTSQLLLVGEGPLEEELRLLATQLGIADLTTWAGFREDIPVIMNLMDVFVLTSGQEGFGIVLLEAMASGTPAIATSVGAIPEVVGSNGAGIIISKGDHKALADALATFTDDLRRNNAGLIAQRRIAEQFDLDRMVDETLSAYGP